MNRAFKTKFHNGEPDEKTIVTMSLSVNNGKRFKQLDNKGKAALVDELQIFRRKVTIFMVEVIKSMDKPTSIL